MFDLGCQAAQAIGRTFDGLVERIAQGAAEFVIAASTWWVRTSSVNVTDPAVLAAQEVTGPLVGLILVASVLVQAIRIMITRKGEGLVFVITGLLRYAATTGLGLVLLQTALAAGDALATEILDNAVDRYAVFMRDALVTGALGLSAPVLLVVSAIAAVLALIQYLLMAVRQAGLLVLAAVLPLAASGSLTRSTRGWLEQLIVWLLALVCYKPAAALIYYVGFSYLSTESSGGGVGTALTGLMVLLLAVIAMPVMLKFFSWSSIQIGGSSGGSGILGAAGAIATARTYSGGRAVQRAAALEATGPGSTHAPVGATARVGGDSTKGRGAGAAARVAGGSGAAGVAGAAGAVVAAGSAVARGMSSAAAPPGAPSAGPPGSGERGGRQR